MTGESSMGPEKTDKTKSDAFWDRDKKVMWKLFGILEDRKRAAKPPTSISRLAAEAGCSPGTAHDYLKILAEKGLAIDLGRRGRVHLYELSVAKTTVSQTLPAKREEKAYYKLLLSDRNPRRKAIKASGYTYVGSHKSKHGTGHYYKNSAGRVFVDGGDTLRPCYTQEELLERIGSELKSGKMSPKAAYRVLRISFGIGERDIADFFSSHGYVMEQQVTVSRTWKKIGSYVSE